MFRSRSAFASAALALVVLGCGDDSTATKANGPAFEGVSFVVPDSKGQLVVGWKPAADAVDYRVYVSRIQGRELKTTPAARTAHTSVTITPDKPGTRYYVIVRAANVAGVEDSNTSEKTALANPDTTPPTFAGAKSAEPAGNAGAKVSWDPASDDLTPTQEIVYDVYAGRTKNTLVQVATTLPGDTTITLPTLGVPKEPFLFAVKARDIAGNVSISDNTVRSQLGQDATPPTFAGCDAVTSGSTTATITWKPASDNVTPASAIKYEVYLSQAAGGESYTAPPAASVTADTTVTLTKLDPATSYFVVCRARDAAGNLDLNTAEKPFTTGSDITPPTFAGVSGLVFDDTAMTATLSWSAATDDQTAQNQIVYDVYETTVAGKYDFDLPPLASSAPGATSIDLKNLPTRSTLSWVVRARDLAGNHDQNVAEQSGKTKTSFSRDVQGVFDRNCAVVGCHVSGTQTGGMNLSPAFSYDQTVDVISGEHRNPPKILKRIDSSGDKSISWLYLKITGQQDVGLQMPALQTGNALTQEEINIVGDWIEEGAKRN